MQSPNGQTARLAGMFHRWSFDLGSLADRRTAAAVSGRDITGQLYW
jgi:hypothetical protein